MAVYTKLNQNKIVEILSNYNLGKLESFKGIEEGIENTNYYLSINKKKFILTIYEKRVKSDDLPFFSDLMSSLNKANFKCPAPILNNKNSTITDLEGKKLLHPSTMHSFNFLLRYIFTPKFFKADIITFVSSEMSIFLIIVLPLAKDDNKRTLFEILLDPGKVISPDFKKTGFNEI